MLVVCLCGSTRYKQEFPAAQEAEALQGRIVLAPGVFSKADGRALTDEDIERLHELHRRKIELADELVVVAPDGRIGESTRQEIEYTGVAPDEMTVNLISVTQGGKRYAAMAWLYLPSLWSDEDVVALGEGLAEALAATFGVEDTAIQVLTTVVTSGSVIEAGEALRW